MKKGTKIGKKTMSALAFTFAANAGAATVFAPTDGDVNFILGTFDTQTILAMFDDSDTGFAGPWLEIPVPQNIAFSGPDPSGDWIATNESSASITLSDSNHFMLAISTDNGSTWQGDSSVYSIGTNVWMITFPGSDSVVQVDARVVPVPAAVWLFGSGLVGLVAIARRSRPSRR